MNTIKAKYGSVNTKQSKVTISDEPVNSWWGEDGLRNIEITTASQGGILITGTKILWGFAFNRVFIEDLNEFADGKYIKYGYKNIIDWIFRVKSPYVHGWYQLVRTTKFSAKMENWSIEQIH